MISKKIYDIALEQITAIDKYFGLNYDYVLKQYIDFHQHESFLEVKNQLTKTENFARDFEEKQSAVLKWVNNSFCKMGSNAALIAAYTDDFMVLDLDNHYTESICLLLAEHCNLDDVIKWSNKVSYHEFDRVTGELIKELESRVK